MAVSNIIAKGIGFSPGSTKYIPTHGFDIGEAAIGKINRIDRIDWTSVIHAVPPIIAMRELLK